VTASPVFRASSKHALTLTLPPRNTVERKAKRQERRAVTEDCLAIDVNGDLELGSAGAERDRLLAALEACGGRSLSVAVAGRDPTQPALQLFFAVVKEARRRGIVVRVGSCPASLAAKAFIEEEFGR